jgi:SNF2 family DNA or RNA helicase
LTTGGWAPRFVFYNRHRVVDERGKVLGYKNLHELRQKLQPVLLRRTRESVRQQLPSRTNEIIRITPTEEQAELHHSHMRLANRIARKKFLTEMDFSLRLDLNMHYSVVHEEDRGLQLGRLSLSWIAATIGINRAQMLSSNSACHYSLQKPY